MFITNEIKKEAEYAKTKLGYLPDILNPHTFNEHILNNKFFKRHPLLIQTTDKVAVNDYVTGKGFADLLISNYLITDQPETIKFNELPKKYIIKPNQLSGSIIYVNNNADPKYIIQTCKKWLSEKHYGASRCIWCTQFIKPKIIIQKVIGVNPIDYKFHVINGRCAFIGVHSSSGIGVLPKKNRSYDRDWNCLPFRFQQEIGQQISRPKNLEQMIEIAESLASPFNYARIDLYNENQIYFGEITHFPNSGSGQFTPKYWDIFYGKLFKK